MEIMFKCPRCGKVSIGVYKSGFEQQIICPHCLKEGVHSVMESQGPINESKNMGGGLYTLKKQD